MQQEPIKEMMPASPETLRILQMDQLQVERWVNPITEPLRQAGECLCLNCAHCYECSVAHQLYQVAFGHHEKGKTLYHTELGKGIRIMVTRCRDWEQK